MPETTPMPDSLAPSSRKLLRSTAIAIVTALLLLVTVVMPAEYGVDPSGIGQVLGLTRMGQIKAELAREAATADATDSAISSGQAAAGTALLPPSGLGADTTSTRVAVSERLGKSDTMKVALRPDEGKEIKLAMKKGARVTYAWSTDRGVVTMTFMLIGQRRRPSSITAIPKGRRSLPMKGSSSRPSMECMADSGATGRAKSSPLHCGRPAITPN